MCLAPLDITLFPTDAQKLVVRHVLGQLLHFFACRLAEEPALRCEYSNHASNIVEVKVDDLLGPFRVA